MYCRMGRTLICYFLSLRSWFCLFLVTVLHRFYCNSLHIAAHMIYYLGLDARKPDIVVWKTTKVQTSLRICTVLAAPLLLAFRKVNWLHFLYPNFKILASLCSWTGWFEPYMVTIPEDRFSCIEMDSQWDIHVLLDFSLSVKAATLIFISGCGSAISSAKEKKSGFIYNLVKS